MLHQTCQSDIPKLNHARTREDCSDSTSSQSASNRAESSSLYWIALYSSWCCRINSTRISRLLETARIISSRFSNISSFWIFLLLEDFEQLSASTIDFMLNTAFNHRISSDHHCFRSDLFSSARTFEDNHRTNSSSDWYNHSSWSTLAKVFQIVQSISSHRRLNSTTYIVKCTISIDS